MKLAKVCGIKPNDVPRIFKAVDVSRQEQLRNFGEVRVDPRIGLLVGPKYPSPDFIDSKVAARIIADAPDEQTVIVVTHFDTIPETQELIEETGAKTIQLHKDNPDPEYVMELKELYPDHEFLHVIHLSREYDGVVKAREVVDGGVEKVVLDSINLKTGARGGTGLPVAEEEAKEFEKKFSKGKYKKRFMLAGGLKPGNIIKKIRHIRPGGIDANTGLNKSEEDREKDPNKVQSYFEEAREGFDSTFDLHPSGLWVPSYFEEAREGLGAYVSHPSGLWVPS